MFDRGVNFIAASSASLIASESLTARCNEGRVTDSCVPEFGRTITSVDDRRKDPGPKIDEPERLASID